jgi:ribosome assembly protein YihI (activator of Der GTPase)
MSYRVETRGGWHCIVQDGKTQPRAAFGKRSDLEHFLLDALEELDRLEDKARFDAFLERASAEVKTWPMWKQKILG